MRALITAFCGFLLLVGFVASGCAAASSPVSGTWFTSVRAPGQSSGAGEKVSCEKVGESSAMSILGLVAMGDCSIDRAAQDAEIAKVSHVDHHAFSVLGVYARYSTIVYGE